MLLLIDRDLEMRTCVNCHTVCEPNKRMIQHQFVEGCYHASCCPKCYAKHIESQMASGECVNLNFIYVVGEAGIQPALTDHMGQLIFTVTKISFDRRTARKSRLLYFTVDGVKWMGRGYLDGYFPNEIYCKPVGKQPFDIPEFEKFERSRY